MNVWESPGFSRGRGFNDKDDWKEDENVPSGYEFKDGRPVKTQGDYFEYVKESERTEEADVSEFDHTNEKELEDADEKRYVRIRGDNEFELV